MSCSSCELRRTCSGCLDTPVLGNTNSPTAMDGRTEEKDIHHVISVRDFIIRNVNIILLVCVHSIGEFTKTQYVYSWISRNTDLPESYFWSNTSANNNSEHCATNSSSAAEDEYQKLAARWNMYFTLTEKGIALPILIIFGIYSDVLGRKPLMVVSNVFTALKYGTMAFFIFNDLHIKYVYISFVLSGIGGTSFLFYLGMFAALADTSSRSTGRSFSMALLDAVVGTSAAAAQISAGYIIAATGYFYATILVTGLCVLVALSVIFIYKETYTSQHKKTSYKTSWNIRKALKPITDFYTVKTQRRNMSLSAFLVLTSVFISLFVVNSSRGEMDILYTLNFPFCWSSVKIGYYRAAKDASQMGLGAIIVKVINNAVKDEVLCIVGCISGIASYALTGFASTDWMLYLATGLGIMAILPIPLMRGMFSKTVLPDKQGALFANIYIFEMLSGIGGSALINNIYAETQTVMKGLVFLVSAGVYLLSVGLFAIFISKTAKATTEDSSTSCTPPIKEKQTALQAA